MLTRHGWTAVVAAVAAFIVGRLFGLIELYVLGTGLVFAIVLALFAVQRALPALHVHRVARPPMVVVGESARVDIEVVNRGRRRSPHLNLWEPVGENGGAPMQLAPLTIGESAMAAYRVPTARRGLLQTGPLLAEHRDLLGLCSRTNEMAGTGEVLVVPAHIPLTFPQLGSAGRLGQHLRLKAWGQTGSEFHSLREYVAGDDLRRISWKASARSTGLLVRETALEGLRRCTVVLDPNASEYDADTFELAVSAAASVVSSAAAAGITTRFIGADLDARGPDVATAALRWLASAQPSPAEFDGDWLRGGPSEGLGMVVMVTGHDRSHAVLQASGTLGPDDALVVVTTGAAPVQGRFLVDATSMDSLERSWAILIAGTNAGAMR